MAKPLTIQILRATFSPKFMTIMLFLLCWSWTASQAQTLSLKGQWFEAQSTWSYAGQATLENAGLVSVSQLNRTGGHYFYQADFDIGPETQILDFKNSSVLAQFHHRVFDNQGHLVAQAEGGIQSTAPNPFFLRYGREIKLPSGHYRLITEVSSPFFLAQPAPFLDTLEHYRQHIKPGNALTLLCMGLLLGLAFYYAVLGIIRRNLTDALYAMFILGNLLYNGTALLVYEDLLGLHWFYLVSLPILFSNCAYVFFVFRLLDIRREAHPWLHRTGTALLGLFAAFIVLALLKPNWSLELDRMGVGLFMSYGLCAGFVRARQGSSTARMYLVAVVAFFVMGGLSISLDTVGVSALYVEHLGLLAVSVEALLLAFVLSDQFALLQMDRELALLQKKHSEEANRAKSVFLAAASHDLRQPLAAANLFIDALKRSAPTVTQNAIIQRLGHSMTTFNGLLDALLSVSKLDAGTSSPEYTLINVTELFTWLDQNCEQLARDKKLRFRLHFPVAKVLVVNSDINLLKSVLMNLVSNAIKYTSNGSILIGVRKRGTDALFQVWDTGMGIPQEQIHRIYDEFYQVSNPQRDRTKGMGLGLSIVKRSLVLLGQEITCRSQVNRGTVFEFRLPLADTPARGGHHVSTMAKQADMLDGSLAKGKRFVVVEDDVLVAHAMTSLLEGMGGEVKCFHNAEDVLRHANIEYADYFIADYRLSGSLNGIQLLERLRQKLGKPINAVLMTGDTSPAFMVESTYCSWNVLHKPVNFDELLSSLRLQTP